MLPLYVIQSVLLPKSICKELDTITRQFLWGGTTEMKKLHLVKWKSVCDSKMEGGLGLKSSSLVNEAYMIKLGWRYLSGSNALWSQILASKYCKGIPNDLTKSKKTNWSLLWKGIMQGFEVLNASTSKSIGNDQSTNFDE